MYNEEITECLLKIYGDDNTIQFCKMLSFKYNMMINNAYERNSLTSDEFSELEYETDWWENKYNELLKQKI